MYSVRALNVISERVANVLGHACLIQFGARSQCIRRALRIELNRPTVSKDSQRAPNVLGEFTTRSQCIRSAL